MVARRTTYGVFRGQQEQLFMNSRAVSCRRFPAMALFETDDLPLQLCGVLRSQLRMPYAARGPQECGACVRLAAGLGISRHGKKAKYLDKRRPGQTPSGNAQHDFTRWFLSKIDQSTSYRVRGSAPALDQDVEYGRIRGAVRRPHPPIHGHESPSHAAVSANQMGRNGEHEVLDT